MSTPSHQQGHQLAPESRDLLDAARDGDALPDAERRRLKSAILAQIAVGGATAATAGAAKAAAATKAAAVGKGATKTAAATGTIAATTSGGLVTLAKIGAGVAMIGALGLGAQQLVAEPELPAGPSAGLSAGPSAATAAVAGQEAAERERSPVAPSAAEVAAPPHVPDQAGPDVEPGPKRPLARATPAAPPASATAKPSLAEETALLQRAQAELQAGNSEAALELLDEHQGAHAQGAMAEEREAARVLALCGAGRGSEARAAATAFVARYPRSPHRARVLAACPK